MKILHILDDPKFSKQCKNLFNIDNVENIFTSSDNDAFALQNDLGSFDAVIIHFLNVEKTKIIEKYLKNKTLIWFFWGGDGFSLGKFENEFLLPKTKRLKFRLAFKHSTLHGIRTIIRALFPSLIDRIQPYRRMLKVIKAVDVIVPIVPGDYYLLKDHYPYKAKLVHLNYVNPRFYEKDTELGNPGTNVLLGNSASYTNNHLEAFAKLKEMGIENRKLVLPLNYGVQVYAEHIEKVAKLTFGNQVLSLRDFLPFKEYNKIISNCGIVIMNHIRQQALGNIILAFWNGAHVYMNNESTLYKFLQEREFIISDFMNANRLIGLDKEARYHNIKRLKATFGPEAQKEKVEKLVSSLKGGCSINR